MFRSIRLRIAVPFVILILFTMGGLSLYLTSLVRQVYINDAQAKLLSQARLISTSAVPILQGSAVPGQIDAMIRQWDNLVDGRVTIISSNGTVLGDSQGNKTDSENELTQPEIQQALATGVGNSIRYSAATGTNMVFTAISYSVNGQTSGVIRIAVPLQGIDRNISALQRTMVGATILAAALAIILAVIIAGRTTRPLRDLTEAARHISINNLERTIIPTTHDEIGLLSEALNKMTSQLHLQVDALKQESGRLTAVLAQMTDGVIIADEQGRVRLINPAAQRLFEIQEKDALQRTVVEVIRHYQLVELWRACLKDQSSQEITIDIGSKPMSLRATAAPLIDTIPGTTLLLFQDLSRLRQLENVRRDFISNISHELRTPLASLKALTETLQDSALDDPPAARRFLQQIDIEVDAMTQMVSELLELSRIESGKVLLHYQSVPPCDILLPAVERLQLQAERSELEVQVDCPADLPLILADPPRMEQVIVNLLHNAIKYTLPGGNIRLSARQVGDTLLFSLQDTGVGISAQDLPRIFERFYKADRARSGGGTGLGLAISRHLVEAHGGKIWAESVEGQGSTFFISLPLLR